MMTSLNITILCSYKSDFPNEFLIFVPFQAIDVENHSIDNQRVVLGYILIPNSDSVAGKLEN
jgi:hypothetical protein